MPLYSLDGRRPTLPPEGFFWIAPNASVIGDVVVGLDVGIWFGAVLRGDNEPINIGARTNIQESCTLHTDMGSPLSIGEECTIGHNAILHGCAIGEGSLIGMGAIVLNGARIGRGCLVGAGALVTEGKTFDDHSLIMGSRRQSDPDAGQGGDGEAASVRRPLRRQLAPVRLGDEADRLGRMRRARPGRLKSERRVFAELVGGQRAQEFNRDAAVDVTHDLGRRRADDDARADRRLAIDVERRPRHRDVDQGRGEFASVGEPEDRVPVARRDALVAPVLGQPERLAVGEPRQLGRRACRACWAARSSGSRTRRGRSAPPVPRLGRSG